MRHPFLTAALGALCVGLTGAALTLPAPSGPGQEQGRVVPPPKHDLAKITRDCFQAMKKHETDKLLAFFTDDAVFEADEMRIGGKDALRDLFEFDAVNQSQIDILDLKVDETAVDLRN